MIVFPRSGTQAAHQAFREWQAANPAAYVINERPGGEGMLHRASCMHLQTIDGDGYSLATNAKVVGDDLAQLLAGAKDEFAPITTCSTCKP